MLKHKITKEDYDDLNEAVQEFYKADGDDYLLQIDESPLKAKVNEAIREAKKAKSRVSELEEENNNLQSQIEDTTSTDTDKDKGTDVDSIKKSYETKLSEYQTEIEKLKSGMEQKEIESAVDKFASKYIKRGQEAAKRLIKDRFSYSEDGVKVTDADGNITINTFDDLAKELSNNDDYKLFFESTGATGGGAIGGRTGGTASTKSFDQLSPNERAKKLVDDPQGYQELKAEWERSKGEK